MNNVTQYTYSNESSAEDHPHHDLIIKEFNTEVLNYIQSLKLMKENIIIPVDPPKKSKDPQAKKQRKQLVIEDQDYQNASINNKAVLLETYEKLYLILVDIHLRSKKAKESIEKIKEEHTNLIEEIKMIREKEVECKSRSGSRPAMTSIDEINENKK